MLIISKLYGEAHSLTQVKHIDRIYSLLARIKATENKKQIRLFHSLEGIEGKTRNQTSNKYSKSVYNTMKVQR